MHGAYLLIRLFLICSLLTVFYVRPEAGCAQAVPTVGDQPVEDQYFESSQDAALARGQTSPTFNEFTVGPATVTPYGSVWSNALIASKRSFPGPFTLWILPESDQGEPAFEIDARRSRVGIDINGGKFPFGFEAESAGRLEIDFLGQFLTENATGTRLRHAYWEVGNEDWRFLFGQTWDIISPLQPKTVNFSVGWTAGNIGFRRTQFRLERKLPLGSQGTLLIQSSINQDIVSDFSTEPDVRRESAALPVIMQRVSCSYPLAVFGDELVVGFSGHFGQTGFDFIESGPPPLNLPPQDDARFNSWSANVDFIIPVHHTVQLRGEFFHGANLSPYFGGIGQGVCPCTRQSIHSTGGWFEVAKQWSPKVALHAGFGIDDPANGDFIEGRGLNQFIFANQIWQLTDAFSTGIELTWWRTEFQDNPTALLGTSLGSSEAYISEWMIRYDF